tara:strand:- start:38 stop:508 length:471 start_codon:yes stop_codon:yes gene_type:complete
MTNTVLIVEDNEIDRKILTRFFEVAKVWQVIEVASVEAALGLLERRSFQLIVLDYLMSTTEGLSAFSAVKAIRKAAGDTVLVVRTGFDDPVAAAEALPHVDGWLLKGVENGKLTRLIQHAQLTHCHRKRKPTDGLSTGEWEQSSYGQLVLGYKQKA